MNWTAEQKEELKKLWLDGASASECANILKARWKIDTITRNSIIGIASRMKWPQHSTTASKEKTRAARAKMAPATVHAAPSSRRRDQKIVPMLTRISHADDEPAPIVVKGPAWQPLEGSAPIPLASIPHEHREGMCRWPVGELRDGTFAYCGQPAQEKTQHPVTYRPYCPTHQNRSVNRP